MVTSVLTIEEVFNTRIKRIYTDAGTNFIANNMMEFYENYKEGISGLASNMSSFYIKNNLPDSQWRSTVERAIKLLKSFFRNILGLIKRNTAPILEIQELRLVLAKAATSANSVPYFGTNSLLCPAQFALVSPSFAQLEFEEGENGLVNVNKAYRILAVHTNE